MKKYNHMYTLAFEVVNESPDGENTTDEEIVTALLRRIASIMDGSGASDFAEACGLPDNTFCEDDGRLMI